MAVSTTMEHRLLAWNLPMVKEVVLQAVASGHLTLKGRQVDRSAAWTAIASFKGSAVRNKYEWVATEERRAEHKLFEYGWPGTGEVAERSKFYKRERATADAWEEFPTTPTLTRSKIKSKKRTRWRIALTVKTSTLQSWPLTTRSCLIVKMRKHSQNSPNKTNQSYSEQRIESPKIK
eukprot:GILI01033723.1.p1 GENE.GILI01033723.1~~GILI01033723.1.p1  ORF type:complete len:177 (-),score=11.79 GILI01033723.1:161-691(-)